MISPNNSIRLSNVEINSLSLSSSSSSMLDVKDDVLAETLNHFSGATLKKIRRREKKISDENIDSTTDVNYERRLLSKENKIEEISRMSRSIIHDCRYDIRWAGSSKVKFSNKDKRNNENFSSNIDRGIPISSDDIIEKKSITKEQHFITGQYHDILSCGEKTERQTSNSQSRNVHSTHPSKINNMLPSIEGYVSKLERFELFSFPMVYYLIASDKFGILYRVLKIDRNLIERMDTSAPPFPQFINESFNCDPSLPSSHHLHDQISNRSFTSKRTHLHQEQQENHNQDISTDHNHSVSLHSPIYQQDVENDLSSPPLLNGHLRNHQYNKNDKTNTNNSSINTLGSEKQKEKHTFRSLSEFCTVDPAVYSKKEINDMLEKINNGNQINYGGQNNRQVNNLYDDFNGVEFSKDDNNRTRNKMCNDQGWDKNKLHRGEDVEKGTLKPIVKAYGIVGFVRFLDCYHVTLITKKTKVGSIGGNGIYSITSTETFPLKPAGVSSRVLGVNDGIGIGNDPTSVLLNMWNRGKRSLNLGLTNRELAELRYQGLYQVVDLTKDFFFSYIYDITKSLQENSLAMTSQTFPPPPFKDMYCWNYFLTRELEKITGTSSYHWVMPIMHGAFVQRRLNGYGRSLNLILLARRSRHFAGTRYLKRGVSDVGKVANDVEHEQILHDETLSRSSFSSFLQVRGSIPTFWTQESSMTMPKPPIVLNRVDPTYQATQLHFEDLIKRYGTPIVVVDLVRQSEKREREVIVGNEFRHAIDYLNCHMDDQYKIRYCALDYSHISKHRSLNVNIALHKVATWGVNQTGFFCTWPRWKIVKGECVKPFDTDDIKNSKSANVSNLSIQHGVPVFPMEQKGVLRTNCIDCLDRTNVAQFSAGIEALGQQLVVMGIRSSPKLDPTSNIVTLLIDMYVIIGDHISLQYGGSEAHKKVQTSGSSISINGPMGKHKELLTSIRRYYSNAFTDRLKQDAMNLFLGYYIPSHHDFPLWDMESDYYLHNFHLKSGRGSVESIEMHQKCFSVNWDEDDKKDYLGDTMGPKPFCSKPISNAKRNLTAGTKLKFNTTNAELRIERVRQRCKIQNDRLSVWWRIAILSYIQERLCIHLRYGITKSFLPLHFERLYQPKKLSQFDKIFSRTWSLPIRLSHSAQQISDDNDEMFKYRKNTSLRFSIRGDTITQNNSECHSAENNEDIVSLPFLKSFVESNDKFSEISYLSNYLDSYKKSQLKENDRISSAYDNEEMIVKYAQSKYYYPFDKNQMWAIIKEIKNKLKDTYLDSNDVNGISKLSQSAHIGNEIKFGYYRGLSQHESAAEVTSIIYEQFNNILNFKKRGEIQTGDFAGVDEELKRREMDTPGVIEAVIDCWNCSCRTEQIYKEILRMSSSFHQRSDLTDEKSLKIYSSLYADNKSMSNIESSYIDTEKLSRSSKTFKKDEERATLDGDSQSEEKDRSAFLKKATMMGFRISVNKRENKHILPPLFSMELKQNIPQGFEQINEGMFATVENKFVVFNKAGLASWPPQPVTKVHGIGEDILYLLRKP